jgi:hypothetical protein
MSIERLTLREAWAALAADALAFWALMAMGIASLLLAGCASLPEQSGYDPSRFSAEQLKALAADRSLIAACTTVRTTLTSLIIVVVLLLTGRL